MTDAATTTPTGADPAAGKPDPAAAAAAGGKEPAAAPGGAAAAGQAPGEDGASAVYRPEGLPDHLLGKDERETIDKLFKVVDGYRKGDAARGEKIGAVPDAPEKYSFTPAETVAPYLPNIGEDPVMKVIQSAAHKNAIGDKQFSGFINEVMGGLITSNMLDEPFSADKERAIIAPDITDPGERAKAADRAATDTIAYLDALAEQGKIAKETADWAKGRTDRGHFIRLVSALRSGAPGIETGDQSAPKSITAADLRARQADPRQQTSPAYQAETARLYRELYGDGPERA